MKRVVQFLICFLFVASAHAQVVLPEREQAKVIDDILEERFNTVCSLVDGKNRY